MKLTAEQITQIEEILVLKGLKYDDLKLEVTDHIASEIEVLMQEENISFKVAFIEVFIKWKWQLKPGNNGLWLGRGFSGPKIVMDKFTSYTKSRLVYILSASVPLTLATIGLMHFLNPNMAILIFTKVIRTLFLFEALLIATGWILIWKSKRTTTYSYLFKKRSILVFFQPLIIAAGFIPFNRLLEGDLDIQIAFTYFLFTLFLFLIFDLSLVFKHFQFEKNLSLSKL